MGFVPKEKKLLPQKCKNVILPNSSKSFMDLFVAQPVREAQTGAAGSGWVPPVGYTTLLAVSILSF